MPLPIYGKLTQGEKFDLDTLLDSFDDVESFWNSWWEGRELSKIDRPETIQNGELILTPTINKDTVDLLANADFFNSFLSEAIDAKCFPICDNLRRDDFREILLKMVAARSALITGGPPQIIFAGGGYGAGKTTILSKLANSDKLPLQMCHMVGVDYFKLFVPEFSLIQIVADGRASLTVQNECKVLADRLFKTLIEGERSFILDSSMSNEPEAMKTIEMAKQRGYELSLIAVFTPLDVAIRQAMDRAKTTRRFPHPDFMPASHAQFRKSFHNYVPHFQDVTVFANTGKEDYVPFVMAEKKDGNELAIYDQAVFNELAAVP